MIYFPTDSYSFNQFALNASDEPHITIIKQLEQKQCYSTLKIFKSLSSVLNLHMWTI